MDDLNFTPINHEIMLDPDKVMVCKFTDQGIIDYVNDYFTEITGYEVHEVVGENYRNFVHEEVPQAILNRVLEKMNKMENVHFIIKDKAKDGRYYWFITDFEFSTDKKGNLLFIKSHRKPAPRVAIPEIDILYKKMLKIEKHAGLAIAQTFFEGFLEDKGMSLDQYTQSLIEQYKMQQTTPLSQQMARAIPPTQQTITKRKPKKKKSLIDILFKK